MADPEKAMEVENDHEDLEDEEIDGQNAKSSMAAELLKNPAMFAASASSRTDPDSKSSSSDSIP